MGKPKHKKAKVAPKPKPVSPPIELEQEAPTFTEIGGSPVPGLTLRHVLQGYTGVVNRIAWSPDGSYLASPSEDKTIRIWDARTGACVRILQRHTSGVNSVAWSPDGQHLASASHDKTLRLWDAASGKHLQKLVGHTDYVRSVSWSSDGQRIASTSDDQTIRLWEVASGNALQTLEGHTDWVFSVTWSPDGQRIASASADKIIRQWETASGKHLRTLQGHTAEVWSIAWSPDGQRIASASADKTIRLWEAASGKALQVLEGHSGWVDSISFSSDGQWLASKSNSKTNRGDNTVRLWRCDTWACVAILDEPASDHWPPSLAFHPRLPILATLGEEDTIIRIWELDEALLLGQAQKSVHYTTAKLVLVGDSGVGKTGLGWRLAHGEFKEHASTHGQQFWAIPQLGLKRQDGTECEAVLWDLAGQHVYRQIHSILFR